MRVVKETKSQGGSYRAILSAGELSRAAETGKATPRKDRDQDGA